MSSGARYPSAAAAAVGAVPCATTTRRTFGPSSVNVAAEAGSRKQTNSSAGARRTIAGSRCRVKRP